MSEEPKRKLNYSAMTLGLLVLLLLFFVWQGYSLHMLRIEKSAKMQGRAILTAWTKQDEGLLRESELCRESAIENLKELDREYGQLRSYTIDHVWIGGTGLPVLVHYTAQRDQVQRELLFYHTMNGCDMVTIGPQAVPARP